MVNAELNLLLKKFLTRFGNEEERKLGEIIVKIDYVSWQKNDGKLKESVGLGALDNGLITILLYILAGLSTEIIKDGYQIGKKSILEYMQNRKNRQKIVKSEDAHGDVYDKIIQLLLEEEYSEDK